MKFLVAFNALFVLSYPVTMAAKSDESRRVEYMDELLEEVNSLEYEATELIADLNTFDPSELSHGVNVEPRTVAVEGGDEILTPENLNISRDAIIACKKADGLGPDEFEKGDIIVDENRRIYSATGGEIEVTEFDGDFISWKGWYDGEDDVTVIGAKEDSCYIAFRSTVARVEDWNDNFDPRIGRLQDNCQTPRGAYNGFYNNYHDEMMAELESCVNERCSDTNGEDCIVITGFSQGGAIAAVATVALSAYQPKMTVVFAAPKALTRSCSPYVNADRYIRFCNSGVLGFFGIDRVCDIPMGGWTSTVSFGHYFLLPPGDDDENTHLQYYGKQVGTNPPDLYTYLRLDTIYPIPAIVALETYIHTLVDTSSSYTRKILECAANPSSVTTRGFANNVRCHSDHNCEGQCNNFGRCVSSTCFWDSDCVSGRCSRMFSCEERVGAGGGCGENNDCQPGLLCYGAWFGIGGTCNAF